MTFDHPYIDFMVCIDNDTRTNFTVPIGLTCLTKRTYIENYDIGQYRFYSTCPNGFVDTPNDQTIYDIIWGLFYYVL